MEVILKTENFTVYTQFGTKYWLKSRQKDVELLLLDKSEEKQNYKTDICGQDANGIYWYFIEGSSFEIYQLNISDRIDEHFLSSSDNHVDIENNGLRKTMFYDVKPISESLIGSIAGAMYKKLDLVIADIYPGDIFDILGENYRYAYWDEHVDDYGKVINKVLLFNDAELEKKIIGKPCN